MIVNVLRRRALVVVTALAASLLPSLGSADAATVSARVTTRTAARALAPANSCPRVSDHLYPAADPRVDLGRITPSPSWRIDCRQLYRSDGRPPAVIFEEGFRPKDTVGGQYDVESYVLANQPSPYVSTTYDHDLYKTWWKSGWNYYVDAPGGIDVNRTIGDTHKYASQVEVAFPGGIAPSFVVGVCPVDKATKTEVMSECVDNPNYRPWREAF
ncbi:ADP-ribosyltransferase [Streptomyces sp. BI20]|uniref:ADP-ribosyltransferase n=1 Tax=Streptomyces sp. BI20 TaxID=3403460 RepID=UPI003C752E0F